MTEAATAAPVRRQRRTRRINRVNVLFHVLLMIGAIVMVSPFVWQILTSFKTLAESTAVPPVVFPETFNMENYEAVFYTMPFLAQLSNTALMTGLRVGFQVIFCAAAGYAFARLQFPAKNAIFVMFLAVLMLPSQLFLLSQYQIVSALGLLNTVTGMALPGMFSAFGTFLLRQFYMQIPREYDEAARLDGANVMQTFLRVMLPLSINGMLALAILTAIWSWNDLLWPLVVNTAPNAMPLSVGLASLQGQHLTNYPVLMAGSLLAALPMIVLFIIFQKQMIRGVASAGVKG